MTNSKATAETRKRGWFFVTKSRAETLLANGQISVTAYAVAMRLASYADGSTGRNARPSQDTLAAALNTSTRTVKRGLAELREHGLIEVSAAARGGAQGGRPAVYAFCADESGDETGAKTGDTSGPLPSRTYEDLGVPRSNTREGTPVAPVSETRRVRPRRVKAPTRNTTRAETRTNVIDLPRDWSRFGRTAEQAAAEGLTSVDWDSWAYQESSQG